MANTYTLISSNVLSSSAASVTFSSIPATYTDLVLRYSTRRNNADSGPGNILVTFNGSSSSDYSLTNIIALGTTTILSTRESAVTRFLSYTTGNSSTSNTFSSNEIYIPNYAGSTNKVASQYEVVENNTTTDFQWGIAARAYLRSNTAAVTSIGINGNGNDFLSGSSFYLYGIKNS